MADHDEAQPVERGEGVVVITEPVADAPRAWLGERFRVIDSSPDDPGLPLALAAADGLVIRTYTRVDDRLLDMAPRLKVVGRAGVGLDNVDLPVCARRRVRIVHTPEANTQAVVEYVLAMMTGAVRARPEVRTAVDIAHWADFRRLDDARPQLDELTLGILGLGRIGSRVAEIARAIGMRAIYHDLLDIPPERRHGAEPVPPEALFEQADVVSLHVDGRPNNRGYVGESLISRMKPHVMFINTARGFIVDRAALTRFLRTNATAQAHLDVHEPEPPHVDDPLLAMANAHLYPHLGAKTTTAWTAMSWVVRDVAAVLAGEPPRWEATAMPYVR
jgi:phosphoglycerate dehydrogenase-like enzyme